LIAIPFRILRPDPETDFLAFAIPEAITTTLAGVGSLIVRSSAAAMRFASADLDPKRLAEEADVDVALTGTLLRAGDQIRVTTQMIELPAGTVIWSQSSQTTMADVFALQDLLTQRIVSSLELPLSEREARVVRRDVPASPRAHEFYLRAGQQGETPEGWAIARDLYQRALEEDPRYAPAWAQLARMHLLLGKFSGTPADEQYRLAESAATHALELNPDLAIAHRAYAAIEVSTGRALPSVLRLLDRVVRGTNDPAVFAALVTSCRFCGLLDASAAAHEQARQLDPSISTSASHTYWVLERYEESIATVDPERDFGDAAFVYESMGRIDDALAVFEDRKARKLAAGARPGSFAFRVFDAFRASILRQPEIAIPIFEEMGDFPDPEGQYYLARSHARLGYADRAIELFDRAESGGFFCHPWFVRDPWLDPIRADRRFIDILRRAESRSRDARRAFDEHPSSRVLTVGRR
jgi:TolB-like protein